MNYVKVRPVTTPRVIERVKRRYATQLRELGELGFDDLGVHYDYAPPYYFIGSFFQLFLKFLVQEEWAFAWPFTHATIGPLRYHPGTNTYANVYGLGCMFYNQLPDGALYISATWAGTDRRHEAAKIFKRYASRPADDAADILKELKDEAANPSSLAKHWERHLSWIRESHETLTKEGYLPSLEDFERIELIENIGLHSND